MAKTPVEYSSGNMISNDSISVSVPTSTLSTVASLNLKGGHTYILTGGCVWGDSVTDITTQLRLGGQVYRFPNGMTGGGGCGASILVHPNTDTVAPLQLYQPSGQTRSANVYFRAMPLD